jgi:hypothetical protein
MPLTITFTPKAMSAASYDECIRRLDDAGAGAPSGRSYHTCFGPDGQLRVVDVWASREEFEKFGAVLMPILADIGIDPGVPDIQPSHNVIVGT